LTELHSFIRGSIVIEKSSRSRGGSDLRRYDSQGTADIEEKKRARDVRLRWKVDVLL